MTNFERVRQERRERRKKQIFEYRGWYVTPAEDGGFNVHEDDGDYMDDARSLESAKHKCRKGADEAVRCRLRDAIMETELDSRDEATLRAILELLGHDPDKI